MTGRQLPNGIDGPTITDPPAPDRWDVAAAGSTAAVLILAYVLIGHPLVQYAAWLTVFCIWMAWFVFYGTKWAGGVEG